jgi:hypothetical protein
MASQIFIVVTIGGRSTEVIRSLFSAWEIETREAPEETDTIVPAVGIFCESLRVHRTELPVLYYAEWVDRWLFRRDAADSHWVSGRRFEACCLSLSEAAALPVTRHRQFPEQSWLLCRLQEASTAWEKLAENALILIVREVFSGSTLDREVVDALAHVPDWISHEFDRSIPSQIA